MLFFWTTILVFALSMGFIQTTTFSSLTSVQAQDNFDLNGVWERDDKAQITITQTGSEVIAMGVDALPCPGGSSREDTIDPYFEFKGTIDGNQIVGSESSWCYSGSSIPDENGAFLEPFHSTISDDGTLLTEFTTNRFTGEEASVSYSMISGPVNVEASPTNDQESSTTDQLADTFTSTLSRVKEPLLLAGLVVAVIGGTAAYVKHRSSNKSHQEEEHANIEVMTRGGID